MLFRDMSVSDADFQRMVRFIQDNYGIDLSKKKQLITSRLSHSLRERGYPDFSAFLDHLLKKQDPADLELVLNKLTTNYTFFMREPDHFTFFRDVILPELSRRHQKDRVLSIWSAGCSSGEEPYTLSIYWPLTSLSRPCPRPRRGSTSCPLICPVNGSSAIL